MRIPLHELYGRKTSDTNAGIFGAMSNGLEAPTLALRREVSARHSEQIQ